MSSQKNGPQATSELIVTLSLIDTVSVAVSGSVFSGNKTSSGDEVIYTKDRVVTNGDRYDVDSGHGTGYSLGEGCRRCRYGRFHCETSTQAGTDCDGDGDGPGGTSDKPIPGRVGISGNPNPARDKARIWQPKRAMDDCISPILIDLDHDGFHFGGGENPVSYDMFGDGDPILMNWVLAGTDEAFLVHDANRNGLADHGGELFGNGTWMILEERFAPNGFVGLSQFDNPPLGWQ